MTDTPAQMEMMTVVAPRGEPNLAEAARQLGVKAEDMDTTFGVVPIDPDRGLYAVQVRSGKAKPSTSGEYRGPFSNPRIEPFGPIQEPEKKPPEKKP
jgi:hypothetical protein